MVDVGVGGTARTTGGALRSFHITQKSYSKERVGMNPEASSKEGSRGQGAVSKKHEYHLGHLLE